MGPIRRCPAPWTPVEGSGRRWTAGTSRRAPESRDPAPDRVDQERGRCIDGGTWCPGDRPAPGVPVDGLAVLQGQVPSWTAGRGMSSPFSKPHAGMADHAQKKFALLQARTWSLISTFRHWRSREPGACGGASKPWFFPLQNLPIVAPAGTPVRNTKNRRGVPRCQVDFPTGRVCARGDGSRAWMCG